MKLSEMKRTVLALIEELNPESEYLTDDEDIQAKINDVINLVQLELCRMRKLPDYVEIEVEAGQTVTFEDIKEKSGHTVYQLDIVRGEYEFRAQSTIIKALEDGVLEIEYFRYPQLITQETEDTYEFELTEDTLGIMPYGVAGIILKSDVSSNYGKVYTDTYENMLQRLDSRYSMGSVVVEGGSEWV